MLQTPKVTDPQAPNGLLIVVTKLIEAITRYIEKSEGKIR